jgi:hypothetical protein
MLKSSRAF